MFDIAAARARAIPPRPSRMRVIDEMIRESWTDMREAMSRQAFLSLELVGNSFRVPINVAPRAMIQRTCHESMFGRLHDWEITYSPAHVCWACEGQLEYWDRDEGQVFCTGCKGGWIPEEWSYRCLRCRHSVRKS